MWRQILGCCFSSTFRATVGDRGSHRGDGLWRLVRGPLEKPASRVVIPQEIAWRIFTKGIDQALAAAQVQIDGDRELGLPILGMTAIVG